MSAPADFWEGERQRIESAASEYAQAAVNSIASSFAFKIPQAYMDRLNEYGKAAYRAGVEEALRSYDCYPKIK